MKYTETHEWMRKDGDVVIIGITEHAAEQLGDIVFVELPEVDAEFDKNDACAVVESVKAASDVYMPLEGTIVEINEAIVDEPSKVNEDPQGAGWFFKIRLENAADADELMDEAAYKELVS